MALRSSNTFIRLFANNKNGHNIHRMSISHMNAIAHNQICFGCTEAGIKKYAHTHTISEQDKKKVMGLNEEQSEKKKYCVRP